MFWTVVAPEIMPAWALNQLYAARIVRDLYNKEKGVSFYLTSRGYVHETRSGYKEESHGVWKGIKRWFSLYERKEAPSQGAYV